MHCQIAAGSDLSWKIPLIVVLFLLALAISIAVHSAG
jgi:flagellar basal body-associated protein FliL